MQQSPNLNLPYIMPAQAQKHVTHNEALRVLDALVNVQVVNHTLSTPPTAPQNGERYIVSAQTTATDDWTGKENTLAAYQDGAWAFYIPQEGLGAWTVQAHKQLVFSQGAWGDLTASINPAPLVGINTTADANNRLSVASPASLLTHEGAGHQVKINKNAVTDTASLLYQSNWSGHAEMGLAGDNDFHIKVSADGSNWTEAMVITAQGQTQFGGAAVLQNQTVSSLPSPTTSLTGAMVYVSNASGGAMPAFCDGMQWRRVSDRSVVS